MLPLTPASMCITAVGRSNIRRCKETIEKEYNANIIYGDTDSVFFNVPEVKSIPETFEMGEKVKNRINKIFDKPLEVEFEKACKMLCLLKKNYSFWYYDPNTKDYKYNIHIKCEDRIKSKIESLLPKIMNQLKIGENEVTTETIANMLSTASGSSTASETLNALGLPPASKVMIRKEPALENKGNALSRRDKFKFMKKIYEKVLRAILVEMRDIDYVYDIIQQYILNLVTLEYSLEDLYTIKTVHTNYNTHNMYKTITDRMKQEEKAVYEGLKIEIIILKSSDKKKIGERAYTREELESISEPKKLVDIDYYIELLVTPIEEGLYQIAMKDIIEKRRSARYANLLDRLNKRFPYLQDARSLLCEKIRRNLSDPDWIKYLEIFSKNVEIVEEVENFNKKFRVFSDKPVTNLLMLIKIRRELMKELIESLNPAPKPDPKPASRTRDSKLRRKK
jgi:hypothetical protein